MKIVVLRTGDVAPPVAEKRGEFYAWIRREAESVWAGEWEQVDVRAADVELPHPEAADGFIITGSSSSVTERAPWMLRTEELVRRISRAEVPLFGICFGHQLVAQALGGEVVRNPRGREIGTVEVIVKDAADPLLAGLAGSFAANATHVDTVGTLPPGARVLAETSLEPNAIFVVGETTKCVQYHPEIDGDAMLRYLDARAHFIRAEGGDPEAIKARSGDAPGGAETLRNFVRFVASRRRR